MSTDNRENIPDHLPMVKVVKPIVPCIIVNPRTSIAVKTHALLDSGADATLITEDLHEKLGGDGRLVQSTLSVVGSKAQGNMRYLQDYVLLPNAPDSIEGEFDLRNVLTEKCLPINPHGMSTQIDVQQIKHLRDLPLARCAPEDVSVLIGLNNNMFLLPLELKHGHLNDPFAVKGILGWSVWGALGPRRNAPTPELQQCVNTAMFTSSLEEVYERLEAQVERFWSIENEMISDPTENMSQNDSKVLQMWENQCKQLENLHYELPIPFKPKLELPNSREITLTRLHSLHRRLEKDVELQSKYDAGIEDLLKHDYAQLIPKDEIRKQQHGFWYLPHHPVITAAKPKLRIVFDCAAKVFGISLNSKVYSGPDLTNNLVAVLCGFRLKEYALMADISSMFHQVRVPVEQRDYLRFLWSPGRLHTIKEYRLNVHLFGGTWSPAACSYALRRCADEHGEHYPPECANVVQNHFYVDDMLISVETKQEAEVLVNNLPKLLSEGGFTLAKWTANDTKLLENLPEHLISKETQRSRITGDPEVEETALEMVWHAHKDTFGYKSQLGSKPHTKRGLLSGLSSIFDPLGLVSPFILGARILVQELHRLKLGWDDKVPQNIEHKWLQWRKGLEAIAALEFRRSMRVTSKTTVTLHHFSDASLQAFGVTTYVRVEENTDQVSTNLLMAKSRLAPLKLMTVPRLELQAATLATKIDCQLRKQLHLDIAASIFWTDSTLVLQYIKAEDKRFHTFVSTRVNTIRERTDIKNWHYVRTEENPADWTTKSRSPIQLQESLWQDGPGFLKNQAAEWPKFPVQPLPSDNKEIKPAENAIMVVSSTLR